ncbi:MAG: ribosome-associated translation inhibitor RaiA [Verrucomicrobia bacterium]|nr:ribosome-associated translation inhibitor RaiA [Verrucomicrobiota bacterium]
MQTVNVNKPVTVTARHMPVTDAIRDYCLKKIDGLHLDYPKIMGAHFILAVDKHRQRAELVLHCNNHITIEAHEVTSDLYASIDETVAKAARQMRKHKTRLMKGFRPHRQNVRYLDEQVIDMSFLDLEDHSYKAPAAANGHAAPVAPAAAPAPVVDEASETLVEPPVPPKPKIVSNEKHPVKPMHVEEAAVQLDLWQRDFIIFHNVETEKLAVLYRRSDGGFGLVEPS